MAEFNKTAEQWKAEGDKFCRAKAFYQAIGCYDQALRRTNRECDARILLLNRCHARVSSQHFDSALEDAKAVLGLSPSNEKALFRAAKAMYGLRRFKESADQLKKMVKLYPKNQEAVRDLQHCLARMREEAGQFDFAAMLDEAISKFPSPDMNRADYTGPIEVRQCAIKSCGRGVFATKNIKAGDLLLVEKSFCAVFPEMDEATGTYDQTTALLSNKTLPELRADIATGVFVKLHRNRSLAPAFADLYPGPDANEELDDDGKNMVDDAFVQYRIVYNAFAFSIPMGDWQWRVAHDAAAPNRGADHNSGAIGMWLKASYINHSCYPTVRRSFIGDMMVWRAQTDIASGTELRFGYISGDQDYAGRQEALGKYGFTCECVICLSEINTPSEKIEERDRVLLEIIKCFENPTPTVIDVYFELIKDMESTYLFPPSQDPRRSLLIPVINLMTVCKAENMPAPLMRLGVTLLQGLGFELYVTLSSWRIKSWGYMCDDVVPVLADLLQVCVTVNPRLCEGLYKDLKTAYMIMAGEVESFDGYYGHARLEKVEEALEEIDGNKPQERNLGGDGLLR